MAGPTLRDLRRERKRDLDAGSTAPLRSVPMNGPELLEHAAGLVNRRRREYGEPVDVFEAIAKRWSSVFRTEVSPAQVVIALIDVKLVRLSSRSKAPRHHRRHRRLRRLSCAEVTRDA